MNIIIALLIGGLAGAIIGAGLTVIALANRTLVALDEPMTHAPDIVPMDDATFAELTREMNN
ncbi:MAG: hypothetical protein KDE20_28485 [Caldilineaceae bacterium]|nr:hypothetical protein [Caldilineaceae bacterium]